MNCPYAIKVCTKCKRILVANTMNYSKKKGGKWNLRAECKVCEFSYKKNYRSDNKAKFSEKDKKYYEKNKEKIKIREKERYENNKERILERNKKYYKDNKETIKEWRRGYYKQYYKNNPHLHFNSNAKRRNREENQGNGITKEQWLEMMNFFDWKCAYSGEYIGGSINKNRTVDHIISLAKEGLNEIWNLAPMTRGLNSSKNDKDMVSWYKQQEFFDIDRLMKIYEWQEYAFEKWGMSI